MLFTTVLWCVSTCSIRPRLAFLIPPQALALRLLPIDNPSFCSSGLHSHMSHLRAPSTLHLDASYTARHKVSRLHFPIPPTHPHLPSISWPDLPNVRLSLSREADRTTTLRDAEDSLPRFLPSGIPSFKIQLCCCMHGWR